MALYVNITEDCEKDAKQHNRHREMLRLKEKVEGAQRICQFDNFPPPFLKKRFDRQIRLIADYRTISVNGEEHVVVNFLRTFVRSGNEYKRFLQDTSGFGSQFLLPLVSNEELEEFLKEELRDHPVPQKSKPSEIENHFLYRFLGRDQNLGAEQFVCESERWVRSVSDTERIQPMLLHIFETLGALPGQPVDAKSKKIRNVEIVYRWFPNLDKLFLAGIAGSADERTELEQLYAGILTVERDAVSEEQLLKHSMRTYPAILLAGEDAPWLSIQKDTESNLALSPEETAVLESVHRSDGGYPIFINGRAGSGKSTVLYYLFSDYVNLYLENKGEDPSLLPPLLLSCSDELRRRAHEAVQKLLSHNPRFRAEASEAPEVPKKCFQEFRRFLLGFLSEEEERDRFSSSEYISYASFRRMWNERFGRDKRIREIGADISWHVIRTYIKGLDSEGYLDPEEYEHLPKKQKSVSSKTYKIVYESVFEGWYEDLCDRQGHWDDQDIARFIFESDRIKPVYPAVFCDEAQDFTRVELDLIFRLCLFTDRELGHDDISRVPFAFAGDPFQTLNPTGFRWDAVQAMFHDKLIDALGKNIYRSIDMQYCDLSLNYRSTRNVVRLCNMIQALRAALFDLPKLEPQHTWQMEENSPMPVWFDRNRIGDWSQLGQEQDVMTIVNCMLNEEQEYVKNDIDLSKVVQLDDQGTPINVLSPTRAKGLEFARVALYGFAATLPGDLLSLLDKENIDADTLLPFEYFVNQLYVAASRPKRRLFIIDKQQDLDRLWKIANDETLQEKMWKRLGDSKMKWSGSIGGFVFGNVDSWNEDRGNPEENAERFKQQGILSSDPFLLRSAAALYENVGKSSMAQFCRAHALKLEDKPVEAGEAFQRAGEVDCALQSYWKAGTVAKEHIVKMHETFPNIGATPEYRLMKTLREPTKQGIFQVLQDLRGRLSEDESLVRRVSTDSTFSAVLRAFEKELEKGDLQDEEINKLVALATDLRPLGLVASSGFLAELHYRNGDIDDAARYWEKTDKPTSNPKYRAAKAMQLAKRFVENHDLTLTPVEGRMLFDHFMEANNLLLAAKCASRHGSKDQLLDVIEKLPADYIYGRELFVEVAEGLARKADWKTLYGLASVSIGDGSRTLHRSTTRVAQLNAHHIRNAATIACGTFVNFRDLSTSDLKNYSDYFRSALLKKPADWRDQLSVQVAGAAIENAGRHIDSLKFYELVTAENGFEADDMNFARERWVMCKEKQAIRESEEGNSRASESHMSEANDRRRAYGFQNTQLPDYPLVTKVWATPATKKPEQPPKNPTGPEPPVTGGSALPPETPPKPPVDTGGTSPTSATATDDLIGFDFSEFKFQFARSKNRLNITHVPTMQMAQVTANPAKFQSLDVDVILENGEYVCREWGFTCSFEDMGTVVSATLFFETLGVGLRFCFQGKKEQA
jgi:tetratricopeptide (TPR) repeat protein